MASKRKLMGYKHDFVNGVVDWNLRRDGRVIQHAIVVDGLAKTPDGDMMLVQLKQQAELADPNNDIAVLVGSAKTYRKNGKVDPQSPELWYYLDKFWVKAKNADGSEYYNNHSYLLYEVQVRDVDQLFQKART